MNLSRSWAARMLPWTRDISMACAMFYFPEKPMRPGPILSAASPREKPTTPFTNNTQPTDMTRCRKSRFDLLKVDRYASGALQFSRGCPFQCEFCDIIVTFGRRPRTKRPEQVLEELDRNAPGGIFLLLHCRRQFYRQQESRQSVASTDHPLAAKARLSVALTTEASINLSRRCASCWICSTKPIFAPCLSASKLPG